MENDTSVVSNIKMTFVIKEFIFSKHRWCQHASEAVFQYLENRMTLQSSEIGQV